jgi:hypothetical protein
VSAEAAAELQAGLRELCELSQAEEADLLSHIFASGWDQGCLVDLEGGAALPDLSPQRIEALLEVIEGRPRVHPEGDIADPFEEEPLAAVVPPEDGSGLVLLSQRCDLIKPIAVEPLIEVAGASCCTDPELLANARRYSSTQHVLLADLDEERGWLLDLRTAGHIPKHWLSGRSPSQLLPPGRSRRRFAERVGDRRSRIPVPASVVRDFQSPLRGWLYKGAERNALCAHFSDLLLLQFDDVWGLIAVPGEGKTLDAAEAAFDDLFPRIAERVDPFPLSEDHSDVIPLEQLSVADFYDAYRLDFAQVTFGSKSADGGHAEPAL